MHTHGDTGQFSIDAAQAQAHMRKMSTDERLLLGLYAYESLSVNEIALVLEEDAGAVETALNQVFSKLENGKAEVEVGVLKSVAAANGLSRPAE